MTEWQPIETAPKDGTLVDLWILGPFGGRRRADAWWVVGVDPATIERIGHAWTTTAGLVTLGHQATHWMPLPAPPQGADNDR